MKKVMMSAAAMVLAAGMSLGTAGAASATVSHPSGGTWDTGAGSQEIWSYYYHPSKTHRSSCSGETYTSSGWKARGVWAYSWARAKWFGNKTHYNLV
jgi:lactococcin 972 family bacteriocin